MAEVREPISLRASGQLRRRRVVNRIMEALGTIAALIAVVILAIVVISVLKRGLSAIDLNFFTQNPVTFGQTGGGLKHAILGSALLLFLAALIAVPFGVLVAIYLTEFAPPRVAASIRVVLDMLNGLPSIVIGIFVFGIIVAGRGQSGWAGAFGLAIIMLPLIARSTQEVLLLVPTALREGGLALGAPRWRVVLGVILPTSLSGILTGTVLAVARAAGETAPLLLVSSAFATTVELNPREAVPNLPVSILNLSESPDPALQAQAWVAALVLMSFVLILSVVGRLALARSERKLRR